MAGYFLYTISHDRFSQLITAPEKDQSDVLAEFVCEELDTYLEEFEEEEDGAIWPREPAAMSDFIRRRLVLPDWYSDLSFDNASMWDNILFLLQGEAGEKIGIDFQCSDYLSIYWDCAEIAASQGATMMAEPEFGNRGFRYFGKPTSESSLYPMFSLYLPDRLKMLHEQLKRVESHFATLPVEEGGPKEQFFEGLLPAVEKAVESRRVLWVQTDT